MSKKRRKPPVHKVILEQLEQLVSKEARTDDDGKELKRQTDNVRGLCIILYGADFSEEERRDIALGLAKIGVIASNNSLSDFAHREIYGVIAALLEDEAGPEG